MDEAIKLLREQAILCSRLLELLKKLSDSLKKTSLDTAEIVQEMDPIVTDLSRNSAKSQKFLTALNCKTFGEFISAAEDGVQKDVANRLLKQVVTLQEKMAQGMKTSAELLVNGSKFISFNLNVLSQTTAAPTYGSAAQTATNSNRRIFDANI